jgi:hypothetical protein
MWVWRYMSTILDLDTNAGEGGVSFTSLPLYPRGKSLGTHWVEGWVGLRTGLDAVEKRKILLRRESNAGRPTRSVLCRLPAKDGILAK